MCTLSRCECLPSSPRMAWARPTPDIFHWLQAVYARLHQRTPAARGSSGGRFGVSTTAIRGGGADDDGGGSGLLPAVATAAGAGVSVVPATLPTRAAPAPRVAPEGRATLPVVRGPPPRA